MSPARRAMVVLMAVAAVVAVGVVSVFLVARNAATPPQAAVVVVTETAGAQTTSPAPETTSAPDPQEQALQALTQTRARDQRGLSLDGRWVLQLSSKRDGIVDGQQTAANGSHTFHYTDIQTQFDQLSAVARSAGMTPIVVTANDFGTKRSADGDRLWVLLADPGTRLTSKAAAQAACGTLFPQASAAALPNSCVPRTLVPLP